MIKKLFTISKGYTKWGYIHIPEDRSKKYPVVFFCHGLGERGSTEAAVTALLKHGPLYWINRGAKPDLIVVALQHHSWSIPPSTIKTFFETDADIKAFGNGEFMVTGLSAGGQVAVEYMQKFNAPGFSFVPMSPAIGTNNTYAPGSYRVWGFVGDNDTTTRGSWDGLLDMQKKIGAKVTVYPGGHSGWNKFYDFAWKENGKSIYDWAFGAADPGPDPDPNFFKEFKDSEGTYRLFKDHTWK